MCLDTVIDMNKILDIALGDDFDTCIYLGYENNFYNEV